MPVCAQAVQTANGTMLAIDPEATNVGTCQYVLQTGAEAVYGSLLSLSPGDATWLSFSVIAVWAVAWFYKQAAATVKGSDHHEEDR